MVTSLWCPQEVNALQLKKTKQTKTKTFTNLSIKKCCKEGKVGSL